MYLIVCVWAAVLSVNFAANTALIKKLLMTAERKLTNFQRELITELSALHSPEDKLNWLIERPAKHAPIPDELATPERRIPGCLSGLWLQFDRQNTTCYFRARSDSAVVQGVASLICDLYSEVSCEVIQDLGASLVEHAHIEQLLTSTRKRAVRIITSYIISSASPK